MRVGVTLSPTAQWEGVLEAAKVADELGLDAVGFWDHYHSQKPEWSYITGWAAHAALAMVTSRVRLVPMVLCRPNHLLGVIARESSILRSARGGGFGAGVGAGDQEPELRHGGARSHYRTGREG